jgi:acetolactate decarboxylase
VERLPGDTGRDERGLVPHALHPRDGKAIHQFSFVDALVAGLYQGAFSAAEIGRRGDFGLGCEEALDGELVILDGEFFVCRGDGSVSTIGAHDRLPFAEVAQFEPTLERPITGSHDEHDLEALIAALMPSQNLFYAVRFDGEFDSVTVRETVRQEAPFRGLADAVKDQRESTRSSIRGTLLGFIAPEVFQGLSVADFHLHFIDDARSFGGHALHFIAGTGVLRVEAFAEFTLHLPQVASYLDAALEHTNSNDAIKLAEGTE